MVVYPPRMASFGLKLWGNLFQTIPNVSFFDADIVKKKSSYCKTLNGRLTPEDGSVRPQTLGKSVSDDPRNFIFRRRKKKANIFENFSSKKNQKIDKLPVFEELWLFGRNRKSASNNEPRGFGFQLSTTFGRGVKEMVSICPHDL